MGIDAGTLPKLWLYICKTWLIVTIGALVMPLVVWLMLLIQNIHVFEETMGTYLGNDQRVYDTFSPPSTSGYVLNTNIPKHLGGAVFVAVYSVAMIIFILMAACADLFWKFDIAKNVLVMLWAPGLWNDAKMDSVEYFFLVANAFLKLFIVAATGSMSYTGLQPDNAEQIGGVDTPLFCLYAVFILLGSIPLTIIASMFVIQHNRKEDWDKEQSEKKAKAKKRAAASSAA